MKATHRQPAIEGASSTMKRNRPNKGLQATGMDLAAQRDQSAPAPEPQRSAVTGRVFEETAPLT